MQQYKTGTGVSCVIYYNINPMRKTTDIMGPNSVTEYNNRIIAVGLLRGLIGNYKIQHGWNTRETAGIEP